LPRIFEFYEIYSKVYPNYILLPANAYMFKNIDRKQKLIDDRHKQLLERELLQEKIQGDPEFAKEYEAQTKQVLDSQFLTNLTRQESQALLRNSSSRYLEVLAKMHSIDLVASKPYGVEYLPAK